MPDPSPAIGATAPRRLAVDVVIIGGGLSGLSACAALASAGMSVAIVDREEPGDTLALPYDGRSFAIALGSRNILHAAGVWSHAEAYAEPILEIRVADDNAPLFLHYDHREVGTAPFGWIIESRALRHAVLRRLGELPAVTHLAPMALARLDRGRDGVRALLADGREISARLAVAADGRNSGLREEAGIRALRWEYGQDAITGTVNHERPHLGIAVEHFLPAGPFAILPMTDDPGGFHRSSIVWTEAAALAPRIMALDEAGFQRELERRFGDFLGGVRSTGPRWRYPLGVVYATRMVDRRLALLGDAAHAIHPIAGQGLNLGIRDIGILAEVLAGAFRLGLDVGSPLLLRDYERRRRFDTIALTAVTDGLNRLFSNAVPPLKLARDLGLAAVGTTPLTPLRKLLMRHAMGLPLLG